MASATENPSKQFVKSLDKWEVPAASTYDITGMSAAHVIAIFKSLVNRKGRHGYRTGKVYTFNICHEDQPKISFQLKVKFFKDQPGNGFIWRKDPRNPRKSIKYNYDNVLVDKLKEQYLNGTKKFAQDIKRVFKDNSKLLQWENEIIKDVYFLLLFEIGRRLVKDKPKSTRRKRALDNLRISEAITKIVKLFENEACQFDEVFLKDKSYHCFSAKDPKIRQDAINLLLTQLEELKLDDLEALFHLEEDKKSPEDTASRDNESSEEPVGVISREIEGLSLSE